MPSKNLVDNTYRVLSILNHCILTQQAPIALSIDLEKAFDSFEISFKSCSRKNGFGHIFKK